MIILQALRVERRAPSHRSSKESASSTSTDASLAAKSLYLQTLGSLPPQLIPAESVKAVTLTPYNGTDAQAIIAHTEKRSPSVRSRSDSASFRTGIPNSPIVPVSPAVSMMLLAAASGGPLGTIHAHQSPVLNGTYTQPYGLTKKGSQSSLRSRGSQTSLADAFAYGASISNYSLANAGGISTATSWANASPDFGQSPRIGGAAPPGEVVYSTNGPAGGKVNGPGVGGMAIPTSRSTLEDIAEASSRDELSFGPSRNGSMAGTPAKPLNGTSIVVTESTPEAVAALRQQRQVDALVNGYALAHGFVPIELPASPPLQFNGNRPFQKNVSEDSETYDLTSTSLEPVSSVPTSMSTASSKSLSNEKIDPEDALQQLMRTFGEMGFSVVAPPVDTKSDREDKTITFIKPKTTGVGDKVEPTEVISGPNSDVESEVDSNLSKKVAGFRTPPDSVEKSSPNGSINGGKTGASSPPRVGAPAKRMLGAALGIRHPALGPRVLNRVVRPKAE